MRLYELRTRIVTKDFDNECSLGLVIAQNDEAVYDYLNNGERFVDGWERDRDVSREQIITARGDLKAECNGMFFDEKFGWKDLGEVSEADTAVLKRLGLLKNG